uniref:Uncharacterized protein n=1 Tax=Wuchereria bancrofti TaxID=6293 RepID=A0AAF5Q3G2_WUCBA
METDELVVDGPTVRKLCDWINMWKERLRKSRNNKKVSRRYKMHVLEIASNEKRNGLQLKCKLQGDTHSRKELCAALGISVPIPVLLWLNSTTVIYGHVSISFSFTLGKIAM